MSDIINKWNVLRNLSKDFVPNINSVYIYGTNGKQVIIITNDDNVYAFGDNHGTSCLGLGHRNAIQEPTIIEELCAQQVIQIEFGVQYNFIIALSQNGSVFSWGCNRNGELGIGNSISQYKPTIISALSDRNVVDIKCGSLCSVALTKSSDVYVWGFPVGITPTKIGFYATNQKIMSICCGWTHVLAITNTGNMYYWGENTYGQCGNGNTNNSFAINWCESQIITDLYVTKIACGPHHSVILTTKGIVYCFGNNEFGQCGDGTIVNNLIPKKVNIHAKIVDIAATKHYSISVGLSDNGCCYMWGQCGQYSFNNPIEIPCNNMNHILQNYSTNKVTVKPLIFTDKNNKNSSIMDRIADKFNKREYSDIAFKVENKLIYAQKTHLINVCAHFETMFSDNKWLESKSPVIEIKNYSYSVYYVFMKYLYTDCVDIRDEDVMELLDLANCYWDETLKERCVDVIKLSIQNENVFAIYCTAVKYNSKLLKAYCIEHIKNNLLADETNMEIIMDNAVKLIEK